MIHTFNVDKANKALILVKPVTEDLREEIEILTQLQSQGASPTDPKAKIHVERLKHHFEELRQVGCIAREPEKGLIDFPSFYGENAVFLCWKLGEEQVLFWHGIHEGHEDRKDITLEATPV